MEQVESISDDGTGVVCGDRRNRDCIIEVVVVDVATSDAVGIALLVRSKVQ